MNDYVAVIGAANTDIGGQPRYPLVHKDSNPGVISIGYGGVGRNIAHNLCKLGVPVKLFTAVGDDALGRDILDNCRNLGMDTSNVLINKGETTSMYIYINDEKGDMELALSQVKIDSKLTPEYFSDKMDILNNAKFVVIDCNISSEAFEYLTHNCKSPIFVDPVSQTRASKIGNNIGLINTIKPNVLEAEFLTGMTIRTLEDAKSAVRYLIETGIKRIFMSMGEKGILAADAEHMKLIPACPAEMVCATGAGDSSMAAIIWSFFNGNEDITAAAKAGNAAAALTIESIDTINPKLSAESVALKIKEVY